MTFLLFKDQAYEDASGKNLDFLTLTALGLLNR